jgi:hypothetical protein
MTNIVPQLDDHRAYVFCPTCKLNGTQIELRRDTYQFRCDFGHVFEYARLQQMIDGGQAELLIRLNVIENPSDHSQAYKVFMIPQTWERLNQKFAGRLWVTLGTVFDALADDSIIFIEGKDVKEMRTMGIKTGKDIIAAIHSAKELEKQIADMQKQLELLKPILAAAGVQALV